MGSGRLGCCLEAVALYSGPYLAEGRHLDWIEERSQALQRQLIGVALEAGSALLVERRWLESAELSVRVVAEDPYHEGAYRLLIQALLAAGDTSGARRAFDELTRRLRQDLGVEPPPELASLVSAAHLYEAAVDSRHRGPRAVRIYSDLRLAKSRGQGVSLARVPDLRCGRPGKRLCGKAQGGRARGHRPGSRGAAGRAAQGRHRAGGRAHRSPFGDAHPVVEQLGPDDLYDAIFVMVCKDQLAGALRAVAINKTTPTVLFMVNNARAPMP